MDLNALLDQDRQGLLEKEAHLFDEMTGGMAGSIVLFGAGGLGRKTLAGLDGTGLDAICFADNGEAVQGAVVDGLPVLSAADAVTRHGETAVFVVSVFNGYERVVDQLLKLGAVTVVPFFVLFWKFPERFLPEYSYDHPHRVIDAAQNVREAQRSSPTPARGESTSPKSGGGSTHSLQSCPITPTGICTFPMTLSNCVATKCS